MMCSYTTVNGTAMCESAEWQEQWARKKLGFAGNIVTDCTALNMKASLTALSHTHTHTLPTENLLEDTGGSLRPP